jgi:hypothetical protein
MLIFYWLKMVFGRVLNQRIAYCYLNVLQTILLFITLIYLPVTVEPAYTLFFSGFCLIYAMLALAAALNVDSVNYVYAYTLSLLPAMIIFIVIGLLGSFSFGYIPIVYLPYRSYVSFFAGMLIFVTGINSVTLFVFGWVMNFNAPMEGIMTMLSLSCIFTLAWESCLNYWIEYYLAIQDVYLQYIFLAVAILGFFPPFLSLLLIYFKKWPFAVVVGGTYFISIAMALAHVGVSIWWVIMNWVTLNTQNKALHCLVIIAILLHIVFKVFLMIFGVVFYAIRVNWEILKKAPASHSA